MEGWDDRDTGGCEPWYGAGPGGSAAVSSGVGCGPGAGAAGAGPWGVVDRSWRAAQGADQGGDRDRAGRGDAEHLGYDRHAVEGRNRGDSRNGKRSKTVLTDSAGEVDIEVPRDRDGTFTPVIADDSGCGQGASLVAGLRSVAAVRS